MTLRSRFFAATYDRQMAKVEKAGLRAHRESVLAEATGRVLEIGARTGVTCPSTAPGVESLTMTEPEIPMLRRLERKVREQAAGSHGPACAGRGPPLRGRLVRCRRLDPGALRGG